MLSLVRAAVCGLALLAASHASTRGPAAVGILHSAEWSPGDTVRDGAGEFAVFLRTAQLQRASRAAGLVAVCDRNGMLRSGGERALRRVVFTGVAVLKIAPAADADSDAGAFLTVSRLGPEAAAAVLEHCLQIHGAPPAAADPENPTAREIAAIRAHLQPFQSALALASARSVALR